MLNPSRNMVHTLLSLGLGQSLLPRDLCGVLVEYDGCVILVKV